MTSIDNQERIEPIRDQQDRQTLLQLEPINDDLAELATLEDNWNKRGSLRPSWDALLRANFVLEAYSEDNNAGAAWTIDEIEPEVLGGIRMHLKGGYQDREAWFCCPNELPDFFLLLEHGRIVHRGLFKGSDEQRESLQEFLDTGVPFREWLENTAQ